MIKNAPKQEGEYMEAKQFVCNDCGCRFEYRILKEGKLPASEKGAKSGEKAEPRRTLCPQCESLNITTA
jgi:predicted Zn-ribbon and HTH transcriptional regulator